MSYLCPVNQIPITLVPYQSDTNYFGPLPIRYQSIWSYTNQIPIPLVPYQSYTNSFCPIYQSDTNPFGPLPIRYQFLWSYTNQIPIHLVLYQSDTNSFVLYQSDTNPFGPIPIIGTLPNLTHAHVWKSSRPPDWRSLCSKPVSRHGTCLCTDTSTAHSVLCFRNVKFPVLMCGLPLNLVSIETWPGRPAERLKQVTSGDREVGGGPARQHLGTTNTNCSSHS